MATIRYWAAARAAAGTAEEQYDATSLADLIIQAKAAHDPRLGTVLERCAFVVDEAPIGGRDHATVGLTAASVAEALPPFAGGSMGGSVTAPEVRVGRPGLLAGLSLVVVAGALGGLGQIGETPFAAALFVVQVVLALAWTAALDARGGAGVVATGVIAAGVADGLLAADRHQGVGIVAAVGGVALLVSLLYQLARRPRTAVVGSLGAAGSLVLLEMAASSLLSLRVIVAEPYAAAAAGLLGMAASGVVARAVDAVIRRPALTPWSSRGIPGVVLGLAAAAGVGIAWGRGHLPLGGAGVGVRLAVIGAVLAVVADAAVDIAGAAEGLDERARSALAPLVATLPIAVAAPAVYVAARYLLT
jgi:hypothetical protein